jgi:DNA repair exonuclease SbcCD ATPase subunit
MLLVGWVNAETHKAEEASAILGDLIEATSEDSGRALKQVRDAEKTIRSSIERLGVLERQLKNKEGELAGLRTELLSQAETTRRNQAQIKFAIKMAGAICQVIPVGQPVLGGVGKLADVGADLIGGDPEGVPDTVSKMGKVIEQAQKASRATKKAEQAAKKASEGQKGKEKTKDADAAKGEASAMAKALDGLGPAVSQFGGAIRALQVPQSEVEAELQRLESECPELQELFRDIRKLNNIKTEVFGELAEAFQSLSEGYARLSSNAAATVSMQQQKREQLGRIDQEASLFVRQVGQRSRLTLLKYLYFMVKAYETTMLEPLDDANWELSRVTGKIAELLKDAKGFSGTTLKTQADTLDVLFQQNLDVVRQKLLINSSKLSEVTITRTLALNSKQSPEEMAALNEVGSVVIDPVAHSLLLPDRHLARLSDVKLKEIKFDSQLPDGTDVIVDMIPARRGTLRRDG